jgi:glycosyltransferase involved in cell wall biosynthesis
VISVVMATRDAERDLVEALSPLIPAVVDGLVHELVVSDQGSTDATLAILDEAGARMVEGGLDAAAAAAKGPWLLVITPAARLPYEWIGPVRRALEGGDGKSRRLSRPGLFARAEALLIRKADYLGGGRTGRRLTV